jgi:hypothetical protein
MSLLFNISSKIAELDDNLYLALERVDDLTLPSDFVYAH